MIEDNFLKKRIETSTKIYAALQGMQKGSVVAILEEIKIDIILNGGMVILDGKIGVRKR